MTNETYTLSYRAKKDEIYKRSRYTFHSEHKTVESLLKTQTELLKSFNIIQVIKNSKGDKK